MTMQDVAIEMNSLISLEMTGSQVTEFKWQHLTIKDKVGVFTVKGSRDVIVSRMLWPIGTFGCG